MGAMQWEKLGRIFDPIVLADRGLSAALMPVPRVIEIESNLVRVYFAPRDKDHKSEVHYFDINMTDPHGGVKLSRGALLKHGKIGAFDDSGITLGNIVEGGGKRTLYYTGWSLLKNVPMNNSIGIAEFESEDSLCRYGDGPIMTRTLHEPYSCASPFVLYEDGRYRMWYASMDKWAMDKGLPKHYYNIKYAESSNGIEWIRNGHVAIDYENEDEYAFGRPWVIKEGGLYKMWYSVRGERYEIGYAESRDGFQWMRYDCDVGITTSESGWDSEMIEYPALLDLDGERYMFYNGNGYGKTGIGLARQKKIVRAEHNG